jgi:hypothetical protein
MTRVKVLSLCLLLTICRGGKEEKPKCGVYLAPSSIPGAGLGMYAGDKHYAEGDRVTLGDTVIPISEYDWNNEGGPFDEDSWLWDEYTWNAPVFPGMDEEGDESDLIMVVSNFGVSTCLTHSLCRCCFSYQYLVLLCVGVPGCGSSSKLLYELGQHGRHLRKNGQSRRCRQSWNWSQQPLL